ncbi:flagellar hook capping FlgD N-terminal domain-containing protein [Scatolibacter rhodanostii]|uniref:flagellar hook capping FlgD N-terminal domain-containing protein n=1 Tax=Scatolibacter rhodanostii TaxID=2014781 RepID=UPI000C0710AB|nr:flagellar hook capping FlgD N-terminal domain-containing protein [Scatolibacter rhodanostii]
MASVDRVLGSSNNYNAVFTDKTDNAEMDQMDFIKLMVAQLQNQDFTDPMDNSTMITQMAQFSNMQQMQQMTAYSKTNYAASMVGKTVTASRYTVGGDLDTTTGMVQKISLVDDEYVVYVGGKKYSLSQIMSIQSGQDSGKSVINPAAYNLKMGIVKSDSANIKWEVPTEDEMVIAGLKYSVYYTNEDGDFDTVEKVEAGTKSSVINQKNITAADLSNLESGQKYQANVVVTDDSGNKAVYKPVTFTTLRS